MEMQNCEICSNTVGCETAYEDVCRDANCSRATTQRHLDENLRKPARDNPDEALQGWAGCLLILLFIAGSYLLFI